MANFLDALLGPLRIQNAGMVLPRRHSLNLVSGFTITDNPTQNRTDIIGNSVSAVYDNGVLMPIEPGLNFEGFVLTDDPDGGATTISGGAGSQGSQGSVGAQGAQGAIGSGAQGAPGATGAQGAAGVQGSSGAQGATGPASPTATDTTTGTITLAGDLGLTAATPTVVGISGTAGVAAIHATLLQIDKAVASPGITHEARTTDAATTDTTFTSQAPVAGASTNKNPGSLVFKVPPPASGGTDGRLSCWISGAERSSVGFDGTAGFIALGAGSAASGYGVRLPHSYGVYARNKTNTADIPAVSVHSTAYYDNLITIGDSSVGGGLRLDTPAGTTIDFEVAGEGVISIRSDIRNFYAWNVGNRTNFCAGGGADAVMSVVYLTASQKVVALFAGSGFSTTQMPTNTGDDVGYGANAATNPTADPVGGGIFYWTGGAYTHRGSSGTVTTIGPA